MDYISNVNKMKIIQNLFLEYYDDTLTSDSDYLMSNFNYFDDLQKEEDKIDRLKDIFNLLCQITAHHHRLPKFYDKTEKIFSIFKKDIEQFLSNEELFQIFENNKLILLCLLNNKILKIDEKIAKSLSRYSNYFFYEIIQFYNNNSINLIESNQLEKYNKKRLIGENDNYICQLIREDSIKEFVAYVNKTNISLSSTIERSTFETNELLENDNTTLIEYAAFFGSIQIFNFLRLNNVELNSSLWTYVVHSNNADLIHLLEEIQISPSYYEDDGFYFVFNESIRCHHNDIANYILDTKQFEKNLVYLVKYYNYSMFDDNVRKLLNILIEYNYDSIVKIILSNPSDDIYDNTI